MSNSVKITFAFLFALALFASFTAAQTISSCQTIDVTGNYTLANDIQTTPNVTGACITITAPQVTLDCNFDTISLTMPMTTGILVEDKLALIKNCYVLSSSNLTNGIILNNALGVSLDRIYVMYTNQPLTVTNSNNLNIKSSYFVSNNAGIDLINSSGGNFNGFRSISQPYVISFTESNDYTVRDVWANSCMNSEGCLRFHDSSNNFFEMLEFSNAGKRFMYFSGENDEIVVRNSYFSFGHGDNPVEMEDGSNSKVRLLNVQYNGSEKVNHLSQLRRWWSYKPFVLYAGNNTPVDNATLTIQSRDVNWSFSTNANGTITTITALQSYEIVNATKYNFIYTINASKEGYLPAGVTRDITSISQDILLLDFDFGIGNNQTNTTNTTTSNNDELNQTQRRGNVFGSGCLVDWSCSQWSACSPGELRTRVCQPSVAGCSAREVLRPAESEACPVLDQLSNPVALSSQPQTVQINAPYGLITGAVIGTSAILNVGAILVTLLLLLVLALYVVMGRARASQKKQIARWLKKAEWSLLIIIVALLLVTLFA